MLQRICLGFLVFLICHKNLHSESKTVAAFHAGTTYSVVGSGVGLTAAALFGFGYMYAEKTGFPYAAFYLVPLVGIPAMIYGISEGNSRNEDGEFVTFNRQFSQVFYWSNLALLPALIFVAAHKSKKPSHSSFRLYQNSDGLRMSYAFTF